MDELTGTFVKKSGIVFCAWRIPGAYLGLEIRAESRRGCGHAFNNWIANWERKASKKTKWMDFRILWLAHTWRILRITNSGGWTCIQQFNCELRTKSQKKTRIDFRILCLAHTWRILRITNSGGVAAGWVVAMELYELAETFIENGDAQLRHSLKN